VVAVSLVRQVTRAEPALTPEPGGMNVPLDTADRAADVLIGLRQAGVKIASVGVVQPTLDEVFFAITGRSTDNPDTAVDTAGATTGADTLVEVK
jgi:ABC-2 type transport system ATP-binding protein